MPPKLTNAQKRLVYTIVSAVCITVGTWLAILYANGGFRFTNDGFANRTGLLAANSYPIGAEIYINEKLVSATDDTLYLEPGVYQVRMVKDGFTPWQKEVTIQEALVTQTGARLFPTAPSLTTLTFAGIENISPSPDGQKVVYYTASASAQRKNGLYVLELSGTAFTAQREPRQILEDIPGYDLQNAHFIWSPDSSEVMVLTDTKEVLININQTQDIRTLPDITFRKKQLLIEWEQEMLLREQQFLLQFPPEVIQIATQSAKNVYFSPDKKRLLYTATTSAQLAERLIPPVPATNTQAEQRTLEPGSIYVYDREEDKNFKVANEAIDSKQPGKQLLSSFISPEATSSAQSVLKSHLSADDNAQTALEFNRYHSALFTNTLQWHPNSRHLLFSQDEQIKIVEYDGTNVTTLYSGPFRKNFIYPWPDGNRVLIITAFSPNTPYNLYAIELR